MKTRACLVVVSALWCCAVLAEDWQKGEPVLRADGAAADAPLRRNERAPWYELSNLRKDNAMRVSRGFLVDYKRVGPHPLGPFSDTVLVAKGANGRREFAGSFVGQEQGTVQAHTFGGVNQPPEDNLEVWLEYRQHIGTQTYRMKVSRSITLGSVGQLTFAREWNAEEQRAFDEMEKTLKPPDEAPPVPYRVATRNTKLLAGMPVLAGWVGQWKPAEIIDVRADGSALLKYDQVSTVLIARTREWIAVDDATLTKAATDPSQFKPSVKVLPGGSAPITDDLSIVDANTPIVKGTPLKADFGGQWHPVTVLQVFKDGSLRIHWDKFGRLWDQTRSRDKLMITADTLAALKKPNAAEEFASRAESMREGEFEKHNDEFGIHSGTLGRHGIGRLHDNPIDIAIPKFAVRVTKETSLREGLKLGACWGRRWYDVTVLEVNDDDTVRVRWDKFGDAWDGDISRDNLIIAKKDLRKGPAKSVGKRPTKSADSDEASTQETATGETRFRVVLKSFGGQRIAVTKTVADITRLDLKDAKEFVESAPVVIKQNLSKTAAEKIRSQLQESGATVAVELQ
jgi:ribosomal protein L7/L12